MVLTKEILTAMSKCNHLIFVKRTDGKTYMVCDEIEVKNMGTIKKEYVIEARNKHKNFTEIYFISQKKNIQTMLYFLREHDNIMLNVCDVKMDDNLNMIEIHLEIYRPEKRYDFLLSYTLEKFL